VAKTIIPERLDMVPVLVFNSSDVAKEVADHTILSQLSIAECVEGGEMEMDVGNNNHDYLTGLTKGLVENVTKKQEGQLTKLLRRFSNVFSKNELDLGETPLAKHRIHTGDAKPMRQTLRRQPFHLLKKIDEHVKEMLKAKVIEARSSPWTSNIVVVKKKDDSLRYCVDYRKINSVTRRDAYP